MDQSGLWRAPSGQPMEHGVDCSSSRRSHANLTEILRPVLLTLALLFLLFAIVGPVAKKRSFLASWRRSGCCRQVAVANAHLVSVKSRQTSEFF